MGEEVQILTDHLSNRVDIQQALANWAMLKQPRAGPTKPLVIVVVSDHSLKEEAVILGMFSFNASILVLLNMGILTEAV